MMSRKKITSTILVMLMVTTFLSGCLGTDEDEMVIKIAFSVQDDYDNPEMNPQTLADFVSSETGLEVELYPISSDGMALEALRFGHADIA
ncbi:MAG TPA: hypothetical protein QF802_06060, partial [Candidatus Thalassarchaeaceae archaeon]|nr:hypothetical protein [Candidatus Thalassarchaeaceae archaeon]